jgi:hypothetical protein
LLILAPGGRRLRGLNSEAGRLHESILLTTLVPTSRRAGGAMVASPALQRGKKGQKEPFSPVGAVQTVKLLSRYSACDCPDSVAVLPLRAEQIRQWRGYLQP